jgi:hypothetical protein
MFPSRVDMTQTFAVHPYTELAMNTPYPNISIDLVRITSPFGVTDN